MAAQLYLTRDKGEKSAVIEKMKVMRVEVIGQDLSLKEISKLKEKENYFLGEALFLRRYTPLEVHAENADLISFKSYLLYRGGSIPFEMEGLEFSLGDFKIKREQKSSWWDSDSLSSFYFTSFLDFKEINWQKILLKTSLSTFVFFLLMMIFFRVRKKREERRERKQIQRELEKLEGLELDSVDKLRKYLKKEFSLIEENKETSPFYEKLSLLLYAPSSSLGPYLSEIFSLKKEYENNLKEILGGKC